MVSGVTREQVEQYHATYLACGSLEKTASALNPKSNSATLHRQFKKYGLWVRPQSHLGDLAGKRFGRLTVIGLSTVRTADGIRQWNCICDCGNHKIVRTGNLNGTPPRGTHSCGCLRGEYRRMPGVRAALRRIISGYKGNARRRGIKFDLPDAIFSGLVNDPCHYCGIPPANKVIPRDRKSKDDETWLMYTGIDRLDNSVGYVVGNVVPCCKDCNWAKHTMALDQYIDWISRSYKYLRRTGLIDGEARG